LPQYPAASWQTSGGRRLPRRNRLAFGYLQESCLEDDSQPAASGLLLTIMMFPEAVEGRHAVFADPFALDGLSVGS
jgi:hypothetical protein